uniref:Uncharacterized protein n=1 Tax=Chromera velia CCMP2878 TaxID=1169474 RepID=A0A0G4HYR1_9ALVE|eukprot:Cvel_9547.t1-p1 / transcript=Cvel_9547.t1 / gene=Cvel_9547 / organism=Chromera_velia_CCMP2878 / gene_product=hypothetical protein / transcript_product=hypothetical protein / location=Cvel_scaffold553:27846-28496(-) / protein_length=217 / sequence_SO=supercontig / SO=protein_coding / is_pseudo=false
MVFGAIIVPLFCFVILVTAYWGHWSRDRRGANRLLTLLQKTTDGFQRKEILTDFNQYWSTAGRGCATFCRDFTGGLYEARALYALNAWVYYQTGQLLCDGVRGEISDFHKRVVRAVREGPEHHTLREFLSFRQFHNSRQMVLMSVGLIEVGGDATVEAIETGQVPPDLSVQAMNVGMEAHEVPRQVEEQMNRPVLENEAVIPARDLGMEREDTRRAS